MNSAHFLDTEILRRHLWLCRQCTRLGHHFGVVFTQSGHGGVAAVPRNVH